MIYVILCIQLEYLSLVDNDWGWCNRLLGFGRCYGVYKRQELWAYYVIFQIHGNRNVVLLQYSLKALGTTECLGLSSGSSSYIAIVCDDIRETLSGTMWIHKALHGQEEAMPDEASLLYVVEFNFKSTARGNAYDEASLLYLVEFKFELMRRGDACQDWIMIQMYGHGRQAHESNCASITSLPIKWFGPQFTGSSSRLGLRVAIVKAIYELSPEKRFFKTIIGRRSLFVTHLLMSTKEQHDKKEYVKPDMFFMKRLTEKKKKKPLGTGSSTYNNQRDEPARLSKLNPPSPTKKKEEGKRKEKVEKEGGREKEGKDDHRRIVEENHRGRTISALKIVELVEVVEEEGGLFLSRSSITKGKASSFLGNIFDEIASEVSEMLPTEVQLATRLYYKYWMEKYSNYAEIRDAVDTTEARLAMHARSQGFFVNTQIDMRRLQKANREFERIAFEVVADAQKLKGEIAAAKEALEASKLKHVELESVVEQLTSANWDLTAEVHLCQSEVNAITMGATYSNNLQKIASMALEEANKERAELKAQVDGLVFEAASSKQQLEGAESDRGEDVD
ncbi:Hypothetical predicted protein [Olea europaea subsp. europaea]|uniref:Uncharacterized protein n=1 Tax=Olea europaea subsp. europaea TaxID=158383 RepID=A0A8S0THX2_OLEEU|nr:Hypothetical predicted protein [Olea europaea subsp. europaea]